MKRAICLILSLILLFTNIIYPKIDISATIGETTLESSYNIKNSFNPTTINNLNN